MAEIEAEAGRTSGQEVEGELETMLKAGGSPEATGVSRNNKLRP